MFAGGSVAQAGTIVRSGAGADPADITPARDQFRTDIGGGTTAGLNGSFGGVRREINWDGTPDPNSDPAPLPPDFFKPRGVLFSGSAGGFIVSGAATQFSGHNLNYALQFDPFSDAKMFSAFGSTVYDVDFVLPGTTTPASSTAFGAVFVDNDLPDISKIELIDAAGKVIATQAAPTPGVNNEGLSFVGIKLTDGQRAAKARITTGNLPMQSQADISAGGPGDVVVLDDFLYAEPTARTAAAAKFGQLKKLKLKKGKTKSLKVAVDNGGETAAGGVKVCAKLPGDSAEALKLKGGKCKTVSLGVLGQATASFKVKSKGKTGSYKVKLEVKGDGIATQKSTAKVKVS